MKEDEDQINDLVIFYSVTQINDLEHRKAKNNPSEQKEEKRIQKNEDRISSLWDNFKYPNICITWVPAGEEKQQEIGSLFEKIMKENLPNLCRKEMCKCRKHRDSQTRWIQRGSLQGTS